MSAWKTMESAPRDRRILASNERGEVTVVEWDGRYKEGYQWRDICEPETDEFGSIVFDDAAPTHWTDLPAPPLPGESNARFIAGPHKETR